MPQEQESQNQGSEIVNPLLVMDVRPSHNWVEWMERWQTAKTLEEWEGLLHAGYGASLPSPRELPKTPVIGRDEFYLTVADGWRKEELFHAPGDDSQGYRVNGEHRYSHQLRQRLAQKAFGVLCQNLFKAELMDKRYGYEGFHPFWTEVVTSERLFPVIQSFFRVEERYRWKQVRNLTQHSSQRSHNEKQAVEFITNLAHFMWEWREPKPLYAGRGGETIQDVKVRQTAMRLRIEAAKPWMVEVLARLNEWDVLEEWIRQLEESCLARLREVAMEAKLVSYRHRVKKDRLAATLDEACLAGSKAAWFLKRHALMTQEMIRLGRIRDAEEAQEKATQELARLQS